jgi:urease accessory protein
MTEAVTAESSLALVRLLQLASPALPIGAYSYSQGLEWAVAHGEVSDAATAVIWIGDLLELVVAPGEAAVLARVLEALERENWPRATAWNEWFRASRETAELRAETEQMGASLVRLAADLDVLAPAARAAAATMAPITLPAAFALAARGFEISADATLIAYLWSWLENQTLAAMKTVPLGQVAGQRMLTGLGARLPAAAAVARSIAEEDMTTFAPGLAIASSRHETQYTRLFRS